MRNSIYKILPLILIFVLLFSIPVYAVDSKNETPMYSSIYDEYVEVCIEASINKYLSEIGGERKDLFVYAQTSAAPSLNLPLYVYIGKRSDLTVSAPYTSVTVSGSMVQYDVRYNYESASLLYLEQYSIPTKVALVGTGTARYMYCYVSEDIYNDTGTLLYKCDKPLIEEISDDKGYPPNYDFIKDLQEFKNYADYLEYSSNYHNTVVSSKQDILENENNPNDSVFANILSAMTGASHVNNQIVQQISAQINHFAEGVFKPFANFCLNILNNISNAMNGFFSRFDNLFLMVDQLYESGLDSSGNFNIGTMLDYWFVPDMDAVKRSYDNTVGQINSFNVVTDTMLGFISSIQKVEPVAPIFTIPATSFSYSPSADVTVSYDLPEYKISFEWFEDWKPFTDPLIAAFVYITFFWHLFKQIPGILSGSAATTASVGYYNDASIKEMNKKAKGG